MSKMTAAETTELTRLVRLVGYGTTSVATVEERISEHVHLGHLTVTKWYERMQEDRRLSRKFDRMLRAYWSD